MSTPIDIHAHRTGYEPVRATFNGQEYVFGNSAFSVFQALNMGADLTQKEGETQSAYVVRILSALPNLISTLCPTFPPGPWGLDEEMALFQVVTEVLKRAGDIRFQANQG